jgi:polyisoprenoid-binding protein YceI
MTQRLLTLTVALVLAASLCSAETFQIRSGQDNNRVIFVSKAPLETVEGRTDRISGSVTADLSDLSAGVDVRVEVDLRTIETGNKRRDGHMRNNHLETETYPLATFHATEVEGAPAGGIEAGGSAKFDLTGDFTLHGVTRRITVPVEVDYIIADGAGSITVTADFQIELDDYQIERPKFLIMKLDKTQRINLQITALGAG